MLGNRERGRGGLKKKPKVLIDDDISTKARWFKGWKVRKRGRG